MRVDEATYTHVLPRNNAKSGGTRRDSMDFLLENGRAIEVTYAVSGKTFPPGRVAIAKDLYERFVEWKSKATRSTGLYFEEDVRLFEVLTAASRSLISDLPVYFVHRGVDSNGASGLEIKIGLCIRKFSEDTNSWLIYQY